MASQTLPNTARNTAGTVFYYCCQWLTTVFVVRISGYDVSGTFSLVISYANIFGFISLYNLRNYQLSDVTHRFRPQQFTAAYLFAGIAALLLFIIILPFCGFDSYTIFCCIAYMIFKFSETTMHYLFTYFQLQDRYKTILQSFLLKSILPLLGFVAGLLLGMGLLVAILFMSGLFIMTVVFYDLPRLKGLKLSGFAKDHVDIILKESFPLMLSTLVLPYMLFLMRYAIEALYGTEELGYFSTVSMVTVVMTTLAGSVWFVIMPILSKRYVNGEYSTLVKQIGLVIVCIAGFTAVLVPIGEWIGGWAFSLVFGEEILSHMYLLSMTIIGSGCLTVATFFSAVLIAFRKRMQMLLSMAVGAVALTAMIFPVTNAYGSLGALYAFAGAVSLQLIPMMIIIFRTCRKGPVTV